ncbi:MAG TPA: beta-ketoacyl synthase N-terminal-like domain-containing protein, partial [Puia sp.]|nr:beta-ketoacyl synthase N-terminal-like domain-containing protein [Puia sp.]
MNTVYVIDSVRTPIGKYGGALHSIRPDDLLAHVIRGLLQRNPGVDVNAIEDVIAGDANQAGEDNRNVARMAALLAGLPVTVPGNTVNRLCASGLQAIMDAARAIACGDGELFIAGGVESMTRAP